MLKKTIYMILLLCLTAAPTSLAVKPKRDVNKLRTEQQAAKKEIKETSRKINANVAETKRQLSRLNTLSAEIADKNGQIIAVQHSVDSLDRRIAHISDSITLLEGQIATMRGAYIKSLRRIQGSEGAMNSMAFVFAAESFTEAYRRVRYLQQFERYRRVKATQLKAASSILAARRENLDSAKTRRNAALTTLDATRRSLESTRGETDRLVAQLKKEGRSLQAVLKEKQRQARELDRELDKLIAEEQARIERERKAAERREKERQLAEAKAKGKGAAASPAKGAASSSASSSSKASASKTSKTSTAKTAEAAANRTLTGTFESNKGRLLYPVSGRYRIVRGFGRQKHPELQYVEIENSGIDIEALSNPNARAVFDGKVSATFRQPGYGTIVMIRHGNYLSIYANLDAISVKTGDPVKTGQTIGTILKDPEEDNRAILYFELRKERTKLNPTLWLGN